MPPASPYGLFVSPVSGQLVRRYGTPGHIGTTVVPGTEPSFNEEEVVPIPVAEANRYRREYQIAIDTGALIEKKLEDFEAWKKKRSDQDRAAVEALNAAREELAKMTDRKPAEVSDTEAYEHLKSKSATTTPAVDEGDLP